MEITSKNPAEYVNEEKQKMLKSMVSIDSRGRFYEIDYTADYKLDEMLKAEVSVHEELQKFVTTQLMDRVPEKGVFNSFDSGCSAFATTNPKTGDKLMGRNYDFCHVEDGVEVPITAIAVKTAPKNGKRSICFVDSYWLGYKYGFYNDGKTDLSFLMAAPYIFMDGINEDGLAVGVLHLKGNPTIQKEPGKRAISTNVAMRLILDRASTVDEAVELLKQYNMCMESPALGSNHFFIADENGDYAIVEYSFKDGADTVKDNPDKMCVYKGQDYSYVTNFYVDPALAEDEAIGGSSPHGMARYQILRNKMILNVYKLTEVEAMRLLAVVAQNPKPTENTSHTQWSSLYNLSKRSVDISILQEYEKVVSYKV